MEFTDDDTDLLIRLIRDANIKKEPTSDDYFLSEPSNWWRSQAVKQQQIPKSQVDDEFTEKGKIEYDRKRREEFEKSRDEKRSSKEDDFLDKLGKLLPATSLLGLYGAFTSGNFPQMMYYVQKAARNAAQNLDKSERDELAKLRKELRELKKEPSIADERHPKTQVTAKPKSTKKKPKK